MKKKIFTALLLTGIVLITTSCDKSEENTTSTLPIVITNDVISPLLNTAECGGNLISDGGFFITQHGLCYNTTNNPTINDNITIDGKGAGTFKSKINHLTPNTTYYIRAYAINSQGVGYGGTIQFNTLDSVLKDVENNKYKIIQIGTQIWMAQNLQVKKYKDNIAIPYINNAGVWAGLTIPGQCWYNFDSVTYAKTYGALYNWYTVNTNKLCPTGWHVPTVAEWDTLITNLGGTDIAGAKLKEKGTTHWQTTNDNITNETNFTALPGGACINNGTFTNILTSGFWWASYPENTNILSWGQILNNNDNKILKASRDKKDGLSVRCLRD